jgi:hypothetical protein
MFRPSWLLHTARMRAPSEIDRFRCTKKKACTMLNTNPLALPLLRVRARTIAAAGGSFRELDGRAEGPDVPEGPGPHRYRAGALIAVAPPRRRLIQGLFSTMGAQNFTRSRMLFCPLMMEILMAVCVRSWSNRGVARVTMLFSGRAAGSRILSATGCPGLQAPRGSKNRCRQGHPPRSSRW